MRILNTIILSTLALIYLNIFPKQYEYDSVLNKIQIILLIIGNFLVLWKFRKVGFFSIFNIFTLNILVTLSIPAFYPTIRISGIGGYYNAELYSSILVQFVSFYIVFYGTLLSSTNKIENKYLTDVIEKAGKNKNNHLIVFISIFIVLIFIFLGKAGRQSGEALLNLSLEYSFLFIILIKIYSKNSIFSKFIIHIFLFLIMIKTLMYGGRIELIIAALLLYILYYEKKISYRLVTPLAIISVLIFELLAIIRAVISNDYTNITNNRLSLLFENTNQTFLLSTEGDVIYSGMAIIGIIENNLIDIKSRFELFIDFVLTQFLPIGGILNSVTLAQFIKSFTPTGGGGIIFSQFYFWLGNMGIILCALIILWIFRLAFYSKKNIWALFSIFSLILFPRWLFYFPDYLLKFPILYLYGTIFFFVVHTITKKIKRQHT